MWDSIKDAGKALFQMIVMAAAIGVTVVTAHGIIGALMTLAEMLWKAVEGGGQMRKYNAIDIIIIAAWVLLLLFALLDQANAETRTMYVVTQDDPLNVRDSPNLHAPWVYRLERGEAVTVHDSKDGWAYVEWVGQYGWCWAEYLGDRPPVDGLPEGWLDVEED